MKITIITSTYNVIDLFHYTANSIANQTHKDIEWIVIDGASKDGTVEATSQYAKLITYLISEPDSGIYEALNKALPHINGEWVIFLGAGDKFKHEETLSDCSTLLARVPQRFNLAYGRVERIDYPYETNGEPSSELWEGVDGRWRYGRPNLPCHQATFHRSNLFKTGARFDTSYKIAGDAAILLPELIRNGGFDMKIPIALMLKGGISNNLLNRRNLLLEFLRVNRNAGLFWKNIAYQYSALFYHSYRELEFRVKAYLKNYNHT